MPEIGYYNAQHLYSLGFYIFLLKIIYVQLTPSLEPRAEGMFLAARKTET